MNEFADKASKMARLPEGALLLDNGPVEEDTRINHPACSEECFTAAYIFSR